MRFRWRRKCLHRQQTGGPQLLLLVMVVLGLHLDTIAVLGSGLLGASLWSVLQIVLFSFDNICEAGPQGNIRSGVCFGIAAALVCIVSSGWLLYPQTLISGYARVIDGDSLEVHVSLLLFEPCSYACTHALPLLPPPFNMDILCLKPQFNFLNSYC